MISKMTAAAIGAAANLWASAATTQQFINVLTGGTSGVYYPLGVAIGKIYSDKIPNVRTQVRATKASVENLILLQQGRGEIAFALGDSLKTAWEGEGGRGGRGGVAPLKDLSTSTDIAMVAVPKEIVDKIGPPFVSVVIPTNTYTGQDKDVATAAMVNYLVTSSAVSDDIAYQMTKLIFEQLPELANAHARQFRRGRRMAVLFDRELPDAVGDFRPSDRC